MSEELERRVPLVKSTSCIPGTPECMCAESQRAADLLVLAEDLSNEAQGGMTEREILALVAEWRRLAQEAG